MNDLISQEFKDFTKEDGIKLPKHLIIPDREKRLYRRVVKLMEELGEFSGAIMASMGRQRQEKLSEFNPDDLGEEFADVLITLFMVAHTAQIDIEKSLRNKVEKIKARFKNA